MTLCEKYSTQFLSFLTILVKFSAQGRFVPSRPLFLHRLLYWWLLTKRKGVDLYGTAWRQGQAPHLWCPRESATAPKTSFSKKWALKCKNPPTHNGHSAHTLYISPAPSLFSILEIFFMLFVWAQLQYYPPLTKTYRYR